MPTFKLKKYQHFIKPNNIIPFQIGNLYRCRTYALIQGKYVEAEWTITNKSTYRATYQNDGRLHLVNTRTGGYFSSPIEPINFGLWMIGPREYDRKDIIYIIEPE